MSQNKTFGSITDSICPIQCHFNAYKGKDVFKDVRSHALDF